jgi:hypothetical protein
MNGLQCIRCDKLLENSMFFSKTGKLTKTCFNCRKKNLQSYYSSKSTEIVPSDDYDYLIEPEEMKEKLFEQILEIGRNEYMESESGIEFSCKISIMSLNGTSQEVGKRIAEIIGCADGYYYM